MEADHGSCAVQYGTIADAVKKKELSGKTFLLEPDTGTMLTYRETVCEIRQFVSILQKSGFRKGDRAAVMLHTGADAVIAILGIMAAGGVLVMLNPDWKEREIRYVLEDSGSGFLISRKELIEAACLMVPTDKRIPFREVQILTHLDAEKTENAACAQSAVKAERIEKEAYTAPGEEDLALLMYTSGTTGRPKGVMLTHRNLMAEVSYIAGGHGLDEEDCHMLVLPLFHINGLVIGMLTPFVVGMTLVLPQRFSASRFWVWVRDYKVTWVSAVPTIISILLARTPEGSEDAGSMRFMRSASAPLPDAVLTEFETRFGIPVVESMGISEGASQITSNPVEGVRKIGSAGQAVGCRVEIADEKGRPAGTGETGEVRVRGDNIFCGYFHNKEETARALRDGWFYTGDLGRMDEDGYLFLGGRKKEMINRAGEKFSPREIDEVLYSIEGVELAAAVGVPDPIYNEEVVAFVRLREGVQPDMEDIRRRCEKELADFKVPKEIFFIEDFPKGPSGKIQRLKLVEVYQRLKMQEEKRVQKKEDEE